MFVVACWTVWASASATNAPGTVAAVTNQASASNIKFKLPILPIELPSHALSFGLDQVRFFCDTKVLDEPLWKYLASLIYVLLAFYVAKLLDWIVNGWLKQLAAKTETNPCYTEKINHYQINRC